MYVKETTYTTASLTHARNTITVIQLGKNFKDTRGSRSNWKASPWSIQKLYTIPLLKEHTAFSNVEDIFVYRKELKCGGDGSGFLKYCYEYSKKGALCGFHQ